MTQEEKQVILRRFSQMHMHYLKMISSDPENARYYKILVDHYRRQYCALGKSKEEEKDSSKDDNIFL
jgi:Tat protein secretion system quality control protein TatD with DNase activity